MNKYQKVVKQIGQIEAAVAKDAGRFEEVQGRLKSNAESFATTAEDRKSALVSGDSKRLGELEKKMQDLESSIDRDKVLVTGLEESIARLKNESVDLAKRRDEAFSFLAEAWLRAEVSAYNEVAEEVRKRVRRLLACHEALRSMENPAPEIYRSIVGESFRHLPTAKVPICTPDFDESAFIRDAPRVDGGLLTAIQKEIGNG